MRLLLAALALMFLVETPANSQTCHTLSIRNASGLLTGTKQVCVDATGAWIDPAQAGHTGQPSIPSLPASEPSAVIIETLPAPGTVISTQPTYQYQPTFESRIPAQTIFPLENTAPEIVTQEPVPLPPLDYVPQSAPVTVETIKPTSRPASTAWQPTSGAAKRKQLYAKLGLVCVAKDARFCTGGSCTGLCTGQQGWCDGKTGEVYASLEAIERVYCRKKKRR